MNISRSCFVVLGLLLTSCARPAAPVADSADGDQAPPAPTEPYDEDADPAVQLENAQEKARQQDKWVMLVFGGNWCPDCQVLDQEMQEPPLREIVYDAFLIEKIDIGKWDRNMEFASRFHKTLEEGVPAIAVVDHAGEVVFASKAGELAKARSLSKADLTKWFKNAVSKLKTAAGEK